MKTLANLTRSHLRRALALKAGIDAMEKELCKLLGVPSTLVALRDRARANLIPASLRKQIEAAELQRAASGEGTLITSPVLEAHLKMKRNLRQKVGGLAKAGWKNARSENQSSRLPSS